MAIEDYVGATIIEGIIHHCSMAQKVLFPISVWNSQTSEAVSQLHQSQHTGLATFSRLQIEKPNSNCKLPTSSASRLQSQPYWRQPETRKLKWSCVLRCMVNRSVKEMQDKGIQWTRRTLRLYTYRWKWIVPVNLNSRNTYYLHVLVQSKRILSSLEYPRKSL